MFVYRNPEAEPLWDQLVQTYGVTTPAQQSYLIRAYELAKWIKTSVPILPKTILFSRSNISEVNKIRVTYEPMTGHVRIVYKTTETL